MAHTLYYRPYFCITNGLAAVAFIAKRVLSTKVCHLRIIICISMATTSMLEVGLTRKCEVFLASHRPSHVICWEQVAKIAVAGTYAVDRT